MLTVLQGIVFCRNHEILVSDKAINLNFLKDYSEPSSIKKKKKKNEIRAKNPNIFNILIPLITNSQAKGGGG